MRLRAELTECKDDLRRDEEIFGEKMKELKRIKKDVMQIQNMKLPPMMKIHFVSQIKKLTVENVTLKMAVQAAQEALKVEQDKHIVASKNGQTTSAHRDLFANRDSLDVRHVICYNI